MLIVPLPVLASDVAARSSDCQGAGCHPAAVSAVRWAASLPGDWTAGGTSGDGDGGTVPAVGQAYVAAGGGVAVVGTGLGVTGYALATGEQDWQAELGAPPGSAVMSVRAWPGVVTVGLLAPDGRSRTEVVLNATTGAELRRYPAAVFGGAVAASAMTTVVIGATEVTSYDNATGRVRWRHPTAAAQSWQVDGQTLYLAPTPAGAGSAQVTALKVIGLGSGAERTLSSPPGRPFSGTLAMAASGAVLFASPAGVTAYSGSTGGVLWTMAGTVPEGADPARGLVYLATGGGTLRGVDPVTGTAAAAVPAAAVPGSGAVYAIRDGTALGLNGGADGAAWEYSTGDGRVAWTSAALPWPHFFSDVSGLGGSAAVSGDEVVITTCPRLAATPGTCADPRLVALELEPPPPAR
jgi:hypothetical protein